MPVGETERKQNSTSLDELEKEFFSTVAIVSDYEAEFVLVVTSAQHRVQQNGPRATSFMFQYNRQ